MRIDIQIEGRTEVRMAFQAVEDGLLDLRELGTWNAVGAEFHKIEKELFESEGGTGESGKWPELSAAYAAEKIKKFGEKPILQRSGELMSSLTRKGAPGGVFETTAQELTIGTTIERAGYHQRGTKIPQRKVIDFTEAQLDRLAKPITAKIKQLAANSRLRELRGF